MAVGEVISSGGSTVGIWQPIQANTSVTHSFNDFVNSTGAVPRFVILQLEVAGAATKLDVNQNVTVSLNNGQFDTFTEKDGKTFWTRPVAPNDVKIGVNGNGQSVQLKSYGFGESDVFLTNGDTSATENRVRTRGIQGCDQSNGFPLDCGETIANVEPVSDTATPGCLPRWEPISSLSSANPTEQKMLENAFSVGMIVYVDGNCVKQATAALIKDNWILTAAHCFVTPISTDSAFPSAQEDYDFLELQSASFTPDFNPMAVGATPPTVQQRPKFYKLFETERTGFKFIQSNVIDVDYFVSQLRQSDLPVVRQTPTGEQPVKALELVTNEVDASGVPIDQPIGIDDELYLIHHPRARTKQISRRLTNGTVVHECLHKEPLFTNPTTAAEFAGRNIVTNCDVDAGSSGCPIFDANNHKVIGIIQRTDVPGEASSNYHHNWGPKIQRITTDLTTPLTEDKYRLHGVVVGDSSGSMGQIVAATGNAKMTDAQEALKLFLTLLRYNFETGGVADPSQDRKYQLALTEFDSAVTPLKPASAGTATALDSAGTQQQFTNAVGQMSTGGSTSIGGALQDAGARLSNITAPPADIGVINAVLLMTDGLHNTAPPIATGEATLNPNTLLHTIGFGDESSLDGEELHRLAEEHGGDYLRATDGLDLKKFYSIEYGQLLETGVAHDPPRVMRAGSTTEDVTFEVLTESSLTLTIGWDRHDTNLSLKLISPNGTTIDSNTPDVQYEMGNTWAFIRLALPFNGERQGTWTARIERPAAENGLMRLRGHVAPVAQLDYSPDGVHMLSASVDGDARLWNLRLGLSVRQLYRPLDWSDSEDLYPIAALFTSDGEFGLIASRSGRATDFIDLDTGKAMLRLVSPWDDTQMINIGLHPENTRAVGAYAANGSEGGLAVWDFELQATGNLEELEPTNIIEQDGIRDIAVDPTGQFVAVIADSSSSIPGLCLLVIDEEFERIEIDVFADMADEFVRIIFTPDGRHVLIGLANGQILVIETLFFETGTDPVLIGEEIGNPVIDMAAHANNRRVLVCYAETNEAFVWALSGEPRPLAVFNEHAEPITSVAYSPDGYVALTASADHTIIPWNGDNAVSLRTVNHYDERFFFVNMIQANIFMRPSEHDTFVYTGDPIWAQVVLRFKFGARVPGSEVKLQVTRPALSLGEILCDSVENDDVLWEERAFLNDTLDVRRTRLADIASRNRYNRRWYVDPDQVYDPDDEESAERDPDESLPDGQTQPLFNYAPIPHATLGKHPDPSLRIQSLTGEITEEFTLNDREPDGAFNRLIENITEFEGTYQMRAIATYGPNQESTREAFWTVTVAAEVHPNTTEVDIVNESPLPDGRNRTTITICPKDTYGNRLGPGLGAKLSVRAAEGNQLLTAVGHPDEPEPGCYAYQVAWSEEKGISPGVIIQQRGRADIRFPAVEANDIEML